MTRLCWKVITVILLYHKLQLAVVNLDQVNGGRMCMFIGHCHYYHYHDELSMCMSMRIIDYRCFEVRIKSLQLGAPVRYFTPWTSHQPRLVTPPPRSPLQAQGCARIPEYKKSRGSAILPVRDQFFGASQTEISFSERVRQRSVFRSESDISFSEWVRYQFFGVSQRSVFRSESEISFSERVRDQ
jgi:hypothetical protein